MLFKRLLNIELARGSSNRLPNIEVIYYAKREAYMCSPLTKATAQAARQNEINGYSS
ncbi:hypothetical protein V5030_02255 [Moellerella wisconsensis]|uniref:hypothetical protein n=1 Tax=Moellerella wisconsensis TaxID=158849 RepID=UPI00307611AD